MVFGQLAAVLVLYPHAVVWPWSVGGCLAMIVVLFQVAALTRGRTVVGVGLLTALSMLLPAVPFADTPPWLVLILCGAEALVLVLGDACTVRKPGQGC